MCQLQPSAKEIILISLSKLTLAQKPNVDELADLVRYCLSLYGHLVFLISMVRPRASPVQKSLRHAKRLDY